MFFSLFLFFFLFPCPSSSQTCSTDLQTEVPSECQPLLFSPFFIPPQSFNITRDYITKQGTIATLTLTTTENSCRVPAVKFACASVFQPCSLQRISQSLPNFLVFPLPRSPSFAVCKDFYDSCRGIIASSSLPDCFAVDNSTGEPSYPNTTTTYIVNGNTYEVPANHYPEKHDIGTTDRCPEPLRLRDSGKADPPCQYPCPNPLWDHNQHEISYVMTTVGSVITFVSATYVLLAWLAQEKLRKFPANLPMYPMVANILAGIIMIISSGIGHESIICKNEFTVGDTEGFCGVQGFILTLTLGVNIFYFFIICLNLFFIIVLEIQLDRYKWYPYSINTVGLGIPLTFAIIIYATKKYEGGSIWCFTTYGPNIWWTMSTTFGWMGIFFAANMIMIPAIFWKLYRVQQRTGKVYRTSGMLTFVLIFQFVFGWEFAVVVAYDILKDVWEQDIVNCTICNMGLGDNCTVERQYDYWLGMVSNGIFIFAGLYFVFAFANTRTVHVNLFRFLKEVFVNRQWHLLRTGIPIHPSGGKLSRRGRSGSTKRPSNVTGVVTTHSGSAGTSNSGSQNTNSTPTLTVNSVSSE